MTSLTHCQSVIEGLSDYIEGRMSLWDRLTLKFHFWMCPNCTNYFLQFKKIYETTGEVTPSDLPPDFDKVLGRALKRWQDERQSH